ncbi:hypothetical protein ACVXZ0_01305 [Staphylococcus aureus]
MPLSFAYVIFIVFWQVGFSNAVNLTDGLDGSQLNINYRIYNVCHHELCVRRNGDWYFLYHYVLFALLGLPYDL